MDLCISRLDPTPLMVAVYGSRPSSPTAPEHSRPGPLPPTWAEVSPPESHRFRL